MDIGIVRGLGRRSEGMESGSGAAEHPSEMNDMAFGENG